jgi:hypothetical protein
MSDERLQCALRHRQREVITSTGEPVRLARMRARGWARVPQWGSPGGARKATQPPFTPPEYPGTRKRALFPLRTLSRATGTPPSRARVPRVYNATRFAIGLPHCPAPLAQDLQRGSVEANHVRKTEKERKPGRKKCFSKIPDIIHIVSNILEL